MRRDRLGVCQGGAGRATPPAPPLHNLGNVQLAGRAGKHCISKDGFSFLGGGALGGLLMIWGSVGVCACCQ